VTSLNSDSPDTARRLNTEAAKTIRFGGLSPAQALALVTINPARQLHVDKYVGSVEVGKQADLVLWSAPPLSTRARVLQTWIDGREYFDLAADTAERVRIAQARAELIQLALPERVKALAEKHGDKAAASVTAPKNLSMHALLEQFGSGRSPYHNGAPVHICTGE
jgi:adenine deaminase